MQLSPDIVLGLLIRITIAISSVVLVIKLLRKQDQNQVSTTKFAMGILLGMAIITTIQIILIFTLNIERTRFVTIISIPDGIIGINAIYFLLLIVNFIEENKIDPLKISITSFLSGITLLTLLFVLIPNVPQIILYSSFSFVFLFFYVTTVLYQSLHRISKSFDRSKHNLQIIDNIKRYILIVLGGVTIAYFITSIFFINENAFSTRILEIVQSLQFTIPPILLLVGNVYLYKAFIVPDNPVILQPQIQEKLIIMTREGTPIFEYDFTSDSDIESVLLSGAITAITSVLREATQVAEDLGSVQLGDQVLKISSNDNLIGVLFTKQPTKIQEQVLNNLMESLGKINNLNTIEVSEHQDREIRNLVKYNFGLSESIEVE